MIDILKRVDEMTFLVRNIHCAFWAIMGIGGSFILAVLISKLPL